MRKPSPSSLEFALLGMLAQAPQSGYDLRKAFAETPMRHYSDSPGSIYPALRRLKARRWLSALRDKASARRREVFQVTPAGRQALLAWLQAPFDRSDVMRHLDVLLLRFAFFDGNLGRRQAAAFLARFGRELDACIADLEAYAANSGIAVAVSTGALVFSYGLDSYRALRAWVRAAQIILSSPAERCVSSARGRGPR